MLKVGDPAPRFRGRDQSGNEVQLDELAKRGIVVVYFYPKDFTWICSREAREFRDAYEELTQEIAEVVGVSTDSEETHKRFAESNCLPFPLLADADKTIGEAYDVLHFFRLFAKRVTYVIEDGIIRGVFHHELSAAKHVAAVRQLVEELVGARGEKADSSS